MTLVSSGADGHQGSEGQNFRVALSGSTEKGGASVESHKPGANGPGTKEFQHEHDDDKDRHSDVARSGSQSLEPESARFRQNPPVRVGMIRLALVPTVGMLRTRSA